VKLTTSESAVALALDATSVYWINKTQTPTIPGLDVGRGYAVQVFGGEAYWAVSFQDETGDTQGQIRAVALTGAHQHRTLYTRQNLWPSGIKVDSDWVYFRSFGGVYRVRRAGENSTPQLLWKAPNGSDIDANAAVVYWNQSSTDEFPGCLGRANSDGTDARCLDQGANDFAAVRVDDTAVYYVKDGQIWRTAK
jgi:hypothetical protein